VTEHYAVPALRAALEVLEKHPPIFKIPNDRPHSGERDCAACGYPLTGQTHAVGTHEDYRQKSWNGEPGEPCPYLKAMKMIRNTLDLFALDAEDEVVDEEARP